MDMSSIKRIGDMAESDSLARAIVPTRTLQYDADFACYEVANMDISPVENFQDLLKHLNNKRLLVGAGHINAYLTLGEKSGREDMATVKVYQENRNPDAPIKVRVRELRNMLSTYGGTSLVTPVSSHFYEADDMMCRAQNIVLASGRVDDTVIMSGDKDLWMVQGWHACPISGRMYKVQGFGKTAYKEVGNVKPKLIGEGTSWFWHQMIMGDKADNIPGLERIDNRDLDRLTPLKSGKPRKVGSAACGEAKAVLALKNVRTEREAAGIVFRLYYNYYGKQTKARLIEQAYLLWMQRTDNEWDVLNYLAECGLKATPTEEQAAKVKAFKARVERARMIA